MPRVKYQLGLIGFPLGHSLSPAIHAAALDALGLAGNYRLYPVPTGPENLPAIENLLSKLRLGELHGLNVTIPYKQVLLHRMDKLTPAARAVGAVNTIFCENGSLVGDNTDVPGFLKDLDRALMGSREVTAKPLPPVPSPLGGMSEVRGLSPSPLVGEGSGVRGTKTALVLGAGGSARAVVFALRQTGWRVSVAARRLEQAIGLIESLPVDAQSSSINAIPLSAAFLRELTTAVTLVVNTTPVGMYPLIEASPWPEEVPLPAEALIYDLVYNPPETELLRKARLCGLPAANGLGMLVEQAALSFERWSARAAPRQEMWQAAQNALGRNI